MVRRELEEGDAGAVIEFRLVLDVNDLSLRVDSMAVHDEGEVVCFTGKEHVARMNLHASGAEIAGLGDLEFVEANKGDGAIHAETWILPLLFPALRHDSSLWLWFKGTSVSER
jgi:hypothetical protein